MKNCKSAAKIQMMGSKAQLAKPTAMRKGGKRAAKTYRKG
jgi:hypothetical protein